MKKIARTTGVILEASVVARFLLVVKLLLAAEYDELQMLGGMIGSEVFPS